MRLSLNVLMKFLKVFNGYWEAWRPFSECIFYFFFCLDLEWKLTYVGSAESAAHDQVLDTVVVGPVPVGKHKFVFQVVQVF